MAKHTNLSSLFTAIADSIRAKKGTTAAIVADNFPDEIAGIESGTDTTISSNAATASDIRSGKKAYVNGSLVTGTVTERTSSSLTVSGAKVSVPAGIYSSATSKSVATATQATPSISVSSSGLITASATQSAGYVSSGTKSGTKQLSSSDDADFIPSNIKSGVTIFGVTGTFAGSSSGAKRYYGTATADSYSDAFQFSFTTPFSLTSSEKLVHLSIIKEGNAADNEVYLIDYNINNRRLTLLVENTDDQLDRFVYFSEDGFNEYEAYLTEIRNSDGTISITVGICVYESGYTFEDYVSGKNNQDTYIISATFDEVVTLN